MILNPKNLCSYCGEFVCDSDHSETIVCDACEIYLLLGDYMFTPTLADEVSLEEHGIHIEEPNVEEL